MTTTCCDGSSSCGPPPLMEAATVASSSSVTTSATATTKPISMAMKPPKKSRSSQITLDLNLETAHLMDIIEGPAGHRADSIVIRYQMPGTLDDQDVEGDNLQYYTTATAAATTAAATTSNASVTSASVDIDNSTVNTNNNNNNATSNNSLLDDNATVKSSSSNTTTTTRSLSHHRNSHKRRIRRRQLRRRHLDDHIWFIFASIQKFANQFRHLTLRFIGCSFPADALAWLLNNAPQIERLHLRVTFHGNLSLLSKALAQHGRLREVVLDHCRPSLEDVMWEVEQEAYQAQKDRRAKKQKRRSRHDRSSSSKMANSSSSKKKAPPPRIASLEPLLDGLALSNSLRSLTLSHSTMAYLVPPDGNGSVAIPTTTRSAWNAGLSLKQLVQMKSLSKLSLEHMVEMTDADFVTLADTLCHYHSLRTLSIRQCAVGELAGPALGHMLTHNHGLTTLDVNMHWWDGFSYQETEEGQYVAQCWEMNVLPILQGLKTNSTLKCLGLYCDNLAYSHNAAVLSILGESVESTTQKLCQTALEALPAVFAAGVAGKETSQVPYNRVLEDLIVGHRSYGLSPEIDFYLNWNRAGRDYFASADTEVTCPDWMDVLLNHRDDVSVVYAMISMNPALFESYRKLPYYQLPLWS